MPFRRLISRKIEEILSDTPCKHCHNNKVECRAMGFRPTAEELAELIDEIDEDGSGAIEFGEFAQLCAKFLVEDPDPETMRAELKQAFRLFDKEGTVRISTYYHNIQNSGLIFLMLYCRGSQKNKSLR